MLFHAHVPRPPLSHFVDRLWSFAGHAPAHARERLLPTGTVELVINLKEDRLSVCDGEEPSRVRSAPGAVVCGAQSRYFVIDTTDSDHVLGVHFHPGGAFPFLGVPADEVQDQQIALEDLWGRRARTLREQLLAASGPAARFQLLERVLTAILAERARHPAVTLALRWFGEEDPPPSVASVSERLGLGRRAFFQVFKEQVGLPPKVFCRIQRFQAALRRVGTRPRVDWAEVAVASGYFDQAHLIHEFQDLAGLSPGAWLAARPLPDGSGRRATDLAQHLPMPAPRAPIPTIPAGRDRADSLR